MKWLWYGASENEQKEKSIVGVKMIIDDGMRRILDSTIGFANSLILMKIFNEKCIVWISEYIFASL